MSSPKATNTDLFLYALYRKGGAGQYIDVEDVFMQMWEIAPSRFSWRKYREPNYKIMSQAIADIVARGQGDLLLGDGDFRQLSAAGVRYIEERLDRFERLASGKEKAPPSRRPSQKIVVELARKKPVQRFLSGDRESGLSREEVAALLRCAPDAPRAVWKERLETLRSAVTDGDRPDLIEFLGHLEESNPDLFRSPSA